MKQARKGYKGLKWPALGATCYALMTATTADAAAIAFGGASVAKCDLYTQSLTYICDDDATTIADVVSIGVNYVVTIRGDGEMKVFHGRAWCG